MDLKSELSIFSLMRDVTKRVILNHCGLAMPYNVGDLGQHWFR